MLLPGIPCNASDRWLGKYIGNYDYIIIKRKSVRDKYSRNDCGVSAGDKYRDGEC